jgi:hypothetical protein
MYLVLAATALMPAAIAKDREMAMPFYVLQAQTVAVMIAPDAAVSLLDPNANKTAQKDVEDALKKWGRFQTVLNPVDADIVIVIRKGTGRQEDPTVVKDPRQNSRPGAAGNGEIVVGGHHGTPPPQRGDISGQSPDPLPQQDPQIETGTRDDGFVVYAGRSSAPTNSEAGWIYIRKDALHPHDVPAVDKFRKAVEEAAKKLADAEKKQLKP